MGEEIRSRGFETLTLTLFLAFATLLLFGFTPPQGLSLRSALGLAVFVSLTALAESFPLKVPLGNAFIGVSGTIYWALVILFHPIWAASAAFIGFLIADLFGRRSTPIKVLFNASQVGLSTMLASFVFLGIKGSLGLDASIIFFTAFAVAVLVYWLSNTWLVALGVGALYRENIPNFWNRNFRWYWIFKKFSTDLGFPRNFQEFY